MKVINNIDDNKEVINSEIKETDTETTSELILEEKIEEWKKSTPVFRNYIDGDEFIIWKPLNRAEYKSIYDKELSPDEVNDELIKLAVLYPDNITELLEERAGLSYVLSDEILKLSGFGISPTESL